MKTSYCSVQPTTQNCLGTFEFRVLPFGKTSLLLETTAIHGGTETDFSKKASVSLL